MSAGPGTSASYALVGGGGAAARAGAVQSARMRALLFGLSGLAWVGARGLFVILYGPLLVGPRRA